MNFPLSVILRKEMGDRKTQRKSPTLKGTEPMTSGFCDINSWGYCISTNLLWRPTDEVSDQAIICGPYVSKSELKLNTNKVFPGQDNAWVLISNFERFPLQHQ